MWLPKLSDNDQPRYLALVDAISAAIERGELKPGDRLPPQRRLAWALGLNPSTAMQAYREAARRHLVGGEVGRGTFVLASSREASLFLLKQPEAVPARLDLSTNLPVLDADDRDLHRSLAALGASSELALLQGYPRPRRCSAGASRSAAGCSVAGWSCRRGRSCSVPVHSRVCLPPCWACVRRANRCWSRR